MQQACIAIIIILLTVAAYLAMVKLYKRFPLPFLIPVLTTTILIVAALMMFHVSYEGYMIGGKWINSLLGPAVVALAYPLYKQWHIIVKHCVPILGGVLVGLCMGMISGLIFAEAFGIDHDLLLSILPKSITTPVAIQIAAGLGGVPSHDCGLFRRHPRAAFPKMASHTQLPRTRHCIRQRLPCTGHLQSIGIWRTGRLHEFRLHDALCGARLILRPARRLAVSYLTKKDCPGGGQSFSFKKQKNQSAAESP